mmetsp:Transcript_125113/g.249789  ORF Transcript_125113/g.249789 Transcript_125113/m.249789 type:complete len:93 (-) Transcript_125113:165-443(-)
MKRKHQAEKARQSELQQPKREENRCEKPNRPEGHVPADVSPPLRFQNSHPSEPHNGARDDASMEDLGPCFPEDREDFDERHISIEIVKFHCD